MKVHCNMYKCKHNDTVAYCSKNIINIDMGRKCMEYKPKLIIKGCEKK